MKGLGTSQTLGTITAMNKEKGLPNGPTSDHMTLSRITLIR